MKYTRIEIERILPSGEPLTELPRDCLVFSGEGMAALFPCEEPSSGGFELKGIPYKALVPGSLLVPRGCGFSVSRSLYLLCSSWGAIPPTGRLLTPFGSFPVSCTALDRHARIFSCRSQSLLGSFPLMDCRYESGGIPSLYARVLYAGYLRPERLRYLSRAVSGLSPDPSEADILKTVFSALDCIRAPEDLSIPRSRRFGAFLLKEATAASLLRAIERLALKEGGFPIADLSESLDIDTELSRELCDFLVEGGTLKRKGSFLLPSRTESAGLSPLGRAVLARLDEAGVRGLTLSDLSASGDVIENLARMGRLVVLDRWLVLSRPSFDRLAASLTENAGPGDIAYDRGGETKNGAFAAVRP
jgi:hypothetical protein